MLYLVLDARQPCNAPPGSEEKIAYLEARRALGLPLFNRLDARGVRWLNDARPSRSGVRPRRRRVLASV
jgi:hypothetical protein